MKISVVIALYNGEPYLKEQLDSIRNQTMPPDEVLLFDDRSTDGTLEAAGAYIRRFGLEGSWKIRENPRNLGYGNNFHRAAMSASGDLIFFGDQDDIWLPEKIETMVRVLEENPDCDLLSTDYLPFRDGAEAPAIPRRVLQRMPDNGVLERVGADPKSIYIGAIGCCMCVRQSFYRRAAAFRFSGWAQDDFLWKMGWAAGTSRILHRNLVLHRIHGGNTSTFGNYHDKTRRLMHFRGMHRAAGRALRMLEGEPAARGRDKMRRMLEGEPAARGRDKMPGMLEGEPAARGREKMPGMPEGEPAARGRDKKSRMLLRHRRMLRLRISLMEDKKFRNALLLLPYLGYYERARSYLLDLFLAMR